ncbi:MAG TPA: ribonuclease P protein component [Candidatus Saccharimonadales bacterium]|nr:ribonuclease P protein component [Candidatus Saccharimonadales bacterium]
MIHYAHRFHGRSSLRFVYQKGYVVRGQHIVLRYARNPRTGTYRMAVVVSRKVSKSAVVRNRIRRRIFEIVRQRAGQISGPYDLVFNVYDESIATIEHNALKRAVVGVLKKARVLVSGSPPALDNGIVEPKEKTV